MSAAPSPMHPGSTPPPLPPGVLPLASDEPRRVGPFRVVGRIGSGGMGVVYAALDDADRRVAVKCVHRVYAGDGEFRERFAREVALVRRVRAACVPGFLGADTRAEVPWLATEYVPGPTLDARVRARGPLTGAALTAFALGVAEALTAIHGAGVVHRDLKPGNVILSPSGPRVLDFGIARTVDGTALTRTGGLVGTPGWTSPEQYAGGEATDRSDMFAWGGLTAFAATGRNPFGAGGTDTLVPRVLSEPPDLEGLPGALRALVERALDKDPARRPDAAAALRETAALLRAAPGGTGASGAVGAFGPGAPGADVSPVGAPAADVPGTDVPPAGAPTTGAAPGDASGGAATGPGTDPGADLPRLVARAWTGAVDPDHGRTDLWRFHAPPRRSWARRNQRPLALGAAGLALALLAGTGLTALSGGGDEGPAATGGGTSAPDTADGDGAGQGGAGEDVPAEYRDLYATGTAAVESVPGDSAQLVRTLEPAEGEGEALDQLRLTLTRGERFTNSITVTATAEYLPDFGGLSVHNDDFAWVSQITPEQDHLDFSRPGSRGVLAELDPDNPVAEFTVTIVGAVTFGVFYYLPAEALDEEQRIAPGYPGGFCHVAPNPGDEQSYPGFTDSPGLAPHDAALVDGVPVNSCAYQESDPFS
ncbi:serine/threonine-protein kinase [Nocardiopsis dassonvillei]|uniref:serine/threonine-protein kinase n=2 Tax=Nocardiopsis dassonvillei TaxID=2014 RepID=UPI001E5D99FF|nr:serine/threonine-protein kinase [Nocardiopsis dassonvillei]